MKKFRYVIFGIILVSVPIILFLFLNKDEPTNEELKEKLDTTPINNEIITINDDLVFEYFEVINLESLVTLKEDVTIVNEVIDTTKLGNHTLEFLYTVDGEDTKSTIEYEVVDTMPPMVRNASAYTIKKGNTWAYESIFCADNYDKKPNCIIEGSYDTNKVGKYNVKLVATDSSNNKTEKSITLNVVESINSTTTPYTPTPLYLQDVIDKHKTDDTEIGIDVSKWQGEIDWEKVKNDGVEFAIIRIGFGNNSKGEIVEDEYFQTNLENAKKAGIPVGLYFYSYANNVETVKKHVNWIIDTLDGETLELPISFDWEEWSKFNNYNMSLTDVNVLADTFIKEVEKAGYKGMNYGSATYLRDIWTMYDHTTWLAHYTTETNYEGDYYIWQLSASGVVDGINGSVDLNVLYK